GFLPAEMQGPGGGEGYLRNLWQLWWRESAQFREHALPPRFWNLAGIRPPNHPHRRLALAAHWLASAELPARLEGWLGRQIESPDFIKSLAAIFEPPEDPFWHYRCTFRSAPSRAPHQLLGENRLTDLAVNVV